MTRCVPRLVMHVVVEDDEIVGSDLHYDHNLACTKHTGASFESSGPLFREFLVPLIKVDGRVE